MQMRWRVTGRGVRIAMVGALTTALALLPGAVPASGATPKARGYWLVADDGGVFTYGTQAFYGSLAAKPHCAGFPGRGALVNACSGAAARAQGDGYLITARNGVVHGFGNAVQHRRRGAEFDYLGAQVAMTPRGDGYWAVSAYGVVAMFGKAYFFGQPATFMGNDGVGNPHHVIGMVSTPRAKGYWIASSDGAVFAFGDAKFHGSAQPLHLGDTFVAFGVAPNGSGYWLVDESGHVYPFGSAASYGQPLTSKPTASMVGMAVTPSGKGYWIADANGGVYAYGDAKFFGSATTFAHAPIVAIIPAN
jgi:hypothetical protein